MTRIDFYRYAEDRTKFACMLTSKAFSSGCKVCVMTPDPAMAEAFDRQLWTYQSLKFIPHCRKGSDLESESPVIVLVAGEEAPHHDVLINLTASWPPSFASFERVLEIVSTDETDKATARDRYRFYKERGYELAVHDVLADSP
jgi:DNA polymerase III subunit chi